MDSLAVHDEPTLIWTGSTMLDARLSIPRQAAAMVLIPGLCGVWRLEGFRRLADSLEVNGFGTLLTDLLTAEEQQFDARTGHFRNDLQFLGRRIADVVEWLGRQEGAKGLPVAFFGSGILGSAGLMAQARGLVDFYALLINAPRPDFTERARPMTAPVLFIIDEAPQRRLVADAGDVAVLAGVTPLLDDRSPVDAVARCAVHWLRERAPAAVPA